MTPVLHLLPFDADFESRHQARILATNLNGQTAEFRTLSAALRSIRRFNGIIHAWGHTALVAAVLSRSPRIIYSPGPELNRRPFSKFLTTRPNVTTVYTTTTLQKSHAIPGEIIPPPPGPITPTISRSDLNLATNDILLLAPGPSTWPANHAAAVWCVSILERLDPRYKLLLWGRGPLANKAEEFASQFGQKGMVILAERQLNRPLDFAFLIPLADLMLSTSRGPTATLPLIQAQSAGLPIVSTKTPTTSELLSNSPALFADPPTPKILAQRVMESRNLPRPPAVATLSEEQFLTRWRTLYA